MDQFWQAKIWGLLHDSSLKSLQISKSGEGPWDILDVMHGWTKSQSPKIADYIASASDRAAIGSLQGEQFHVNYDRGLTITHLLSGLTTNPLSLNFDENSELSPFFSETGKQKELIKRWIGDRIPDAIKHSTDHAKVFWYLWRCLPEVIAKIVGDDRIHLLPAETRIPDCSIWSHNSTTAAIAGALQGLDGTGKHLPHILSFTFTPVQEIIKASRKMQDFWAGSWVLHYLSACICWKWAERYGPDSLVYPSLYAQPLIDYWLREKYHDCPEFQDIIDKPQPNRLLTAGFPNVLVAILPNSEVENAVKSAKTVLQTATDQEKSWLGLASLVKKAIFNGTEIDPQVWESWLSSQWQIYWISIPLGSPHQEKLSIVESEANASDWIQAQNDFANSNLFTPGGEEIALVRSRPVNVGSWWAPTCDRLRQLLNFAKNARVWELPTAFGDRSTISGVGPVVRGPSKSYKPKKDSQSHTAAGKSWVDYEELKKFWRVSRGLFNGSEMLNATEVVKRGLERILPQLFRGINSREIPPYPDLTVGAAGWLTTCLDIDTYKRACKQIEDVLEQEKLGALLKSFRKDWGIPKIDTAEFKGLPHPRLFNAGWLLDELQTELLKEPKTGSSEELKALYKSVNWQEKSETLRDAIAKVFPNNNPTDWYVLVAGDGDDMRKWLTGEKMLKYEQYISQELLKDDSDTSPEAADLRTFAKNVDKRMGPATHAALSRALLDFSNQLLPYLTEQRYAGKLIYGGGDDLFAYTNLWEWDAWLWDVRQCFRGANDPNEKFDNIGDYWQWQNGTRPSLLSKRPLFTMGSHATISLGVVIANQSVPLAIALEQLWEAEEKAKEHEYVRDDNKPSKKDAIQVRVIYSNGNTLTATSKLDTFQAWRKLLEIQRDNLPALYEQAAEQWKQFPCPIREAIAPWTTAFVERRNTFAQDNDTKEKFHSSLSTFLRAIWDTTQNDEKTCSQAVTNWLRLAAFTLRKREIKINSNLMLTSSYV